jgi:hypothetical protein
MRRFDGDRGFQRQADRLAPGHLSQNRFKSRSGLPSASPGNTHSQSSGARCKRRCLVVGAGLIGRRLRDRIDLTARQAPRHAGRKSNMIRCTASAARRFEWPSRAVKAARCHRAVDSDLGARNPATGLSESRARYPAVRPPRGCNAGRKTLHCVHSAGSVVHLQRVVRFRPSEIVHGSFILPLSRGLILSIYAGRAGLRPRIRRTKAQAFQCIGAGWSSPVARQAHNLKVTGSNPVPATNSTYRKPRESGVFRFRAPPGAPR